MCEQRRSRDQLVQTIGAVVAMLPLRSRTASTLPTMGKHECERVGGIGMLSVCKELLDCCWPSRTSLGTSNLTSLDWALGVSV